MINSRESEVGTVSFIRNYGCIPIRVIMVRDLCTNKKWLVGHHFAKSGHVHHFDGEDTLCKYNKLQTFCHLKNSIAVSFPTRILSDMASNRPWLSIQVFKLYAQMKALNS